MQQRFLAILIMIFIPVFFALAGGCSKESGISGTWKGKITLPETGKSLADLEFSLNQKGKDITGTMNFTKPGAKLPLTGTLADGTLSLSSPMKDGLSVAITGKLETRQKISGTAVLNYDTPQLGKRQDKAVLELTR